MPLDEASLMDYPEAFVVVQEYSFSTLDETYVEAAHSSIHNSIRKPGFTLPAQIAASFRQHEWQALLRDEQFLAFFVAQWPRRIWRHVLQPLLGSRMVPLRLNAIHALIYG